MLNLAHDIASRHPHNHPGVEAGAPRPSSAYRPAAAGDGLQGSASNQELVGRGVEVTFGDLKT